MNRQPAILIPEIDNILHMLCGPYDEHLKLIEQEFGCPVRISDSEIRLETSDDEQIRKFQHFCTKLFSVCRIGEEITKNTIESLLMEDFEQEKRAIEITFGHNSHIFPKNEHQKSFIEGMRNHTVCFAIGPAGTGKTFLAISQGLQFLQTRKIQRLIYTRPVIETGESLGYLPGDVQEKISPYMRPFFDILKTLTDKTSIDRLLEYERVELVPLAYMRGRDIKNAFVILDEAQNATDIQMKMLLTRIGLCSQLVVIGDPKQSDRTSGESIPLQTLAAKLAHIPSVFSTTFGLQDCVRSRFVQEVLKAYET